MTERSHKPERKDADDVRDRYDYEPEGRSRDTDKSEDTDGYASVSEKDTPTFFTDSGETPDVLAESLEDKDPSKLKALAKRTRRFAEEVEEIEVTVARKEHLTEEVSEEALEEDEKGDTAEAEVEVGTDFIDEDLDLSEMREELEERIEELEETVEDDEVLSEAREMKRRSEAASENPVVSFSDYRFETTRYFNVVEERFSKVGFEIDIGDETAELEPGVWDTDRDDGSGLLTAEAKVGGLINKRKVKVQVQTHPDPEDFEGSGNVVMGYDTDLEESVTRFMREDVPEEYYLLVIATPVSASELPEKAIERTREFVDAEKSLIIADMENAELVYNETDGVAETVSKREILSPETQEAEVSRLSNKFEEKMISGDELAASEAAEQHSVSERVATRAFSEVAESHSEFSVLTEKVPEPILVRW